jgi:hypothetical protein
MSTDENHDEPESSPPGTFVSEDQRSQTARFLDELKKRLRREHAEEPKLGPPPKQTPSSEGSEGGAPGAMR